MTTDFSLRINACNATTIYFEWLIAISIKCFFFHFMLSCACFFVNAPIHYVARQKWREHQIANYSHLFDICCWFGIFRHLFASPNTELIQIWCSNSYTWRMSFFFSVSHCIFCSSVNWEFSEKKQSQCKVVNLHIVDPHSKVQTRRKCTWQVCTQYMMEKIGSACSSLALSERKKVLFETHSFRYAHFFLVLIHIPVFLLDSIRNRFAAFTLMLKSANGGKQEPPASNAILSV